MQMPWRRKPAAPDGAIQVSVPLELAAQLSPAGGSLESVVVAILQQAVASRTAAPLAAGGASVPVKPVPFWLERKPADSQEGEADSGGQVEDALLDKIATRRLTESGDGPPTVARDTGNKGD